MLLLSVTALGALVAVAQNPGAEIPHAASSNSATFIPLIAAIGFVLARRK